ncbi:hypothetical protein DEU56DRAFT_899384 [Suillus clintonianus]|uniref:uncharacterized protein n=1 Tax=Suillus clintonianus TaxID=1904413 RepID=UPI001B874B4E|nr:uncharacterized protein DEU56DRAFT_899384 [Suillus clintonianus]KAG2147493.1 hypothetical protein DEU56DRAFT_899384 [Suillus clintonianus]
MYSEESDSRFGTPMAQPEASTRILFNYNDTVTFPEPSSQPNLTAADQSQHDQSYTSSFRADSQPSSSSYTYPPSANQNFVAISVQPAAEAHYPSIAAARRSERSLALYSRDSDPSRFSNFLHLYAEAQSGPSQNINLPYIDSATSYDPSFVSYFNNLDNNLPQAIVSTDGMSTFPIDAEEIPSLPVGEPVPFEERSFRPNEILRLQPLEPPLPVLGEPSPLPTRQKSAGRSRTRASKSSDMQFHPYAGVSQAKLRGFSAVTEDTVTLDTQAVPSQATLLPVGPSIYDECSKTHQRIFKNAQESLIRDAVNITPFLSEHEKKQAAQQALINAASHYESGKKWAENNTQIFYRSLSPMPSAQIMATAKKVAREVVQRGCGLRPPVRLRISERMHQTQTAKNLLASFPPQFIFWKDEDGRSWAFENDVILDVVLNTVVELGYLPYITDPTLKTLFFTASTAVKCTLQEHSTREEIKFSVSDFRSSYNSFSDYFDKEILPNPELFGRWKEFNDTVTPSEASIWPPIGRQGTNMRFLTGHLICDLASGGARSMIASTTWSHTEMCKTHLKSDRQDIDPDDTAAHFNGTVSSPDMLMTFVRHCLRNKTLNGGRAELNEYILLHEFHRLKYICPDTTYGKKAPKAEPEADDADGEGGGGGKSSQAKANGTSSRAYILVMDFNSLYPSIIQEYNIDFTTVERSQEDDDDDKIPDPPPPEVPQGALPRLIATLVNRRRQVKSLMKDRSISHAKLLQYDIKQHALKLTANSMYGCLGFEYSRFYAKPLAALTTFKGREILTHTRELAESLQLDVVYGDTDSVFVNFNVIELSEAIKISAEFKKAVNDRYKLLEIDLDAVFARLLLLQKKKYAALKVEEGSRTSTEVKGLDMKRREYCALSKSVSQYVLEQILSGEPTEVVVENIHEHLNTIGENVRGRKIKLEDFIVYKGGGARNGDVIPYVFCVAPGEETVKTAQADRAKHPDEIKKAAGELVVDYEHYLANQPIEGTDRARLAECLGLDPGRYRISGSTQAGSELTTLDSLVSDAERFRDVAPFLVRCRGCAGQMAFTPVYDRDASIMLSSGLTCPACSAPLGSASLQTQLEVQIRSFVAKYYEGWVVCEDPACGYETRSMRMYGWRCGAPGGCKGRAQFKYWDTELYTQLRYCSTLFDVEKIIKAAQGSARKEEIEAVAANNDPFLRVMSKTVDKYMEQCGRCWVNLGALFSSMNL